MRMMACTVTVEHLICAHKYLRVAFCVTLRTKNLFYELLSNEIATCLLQVDTEERGDKLTVKALLPIRFKDVDECYALN